MKKEKGLYYFYLICYLILVSITYYLQNPTLNFNILIFVKSGFSGLGAAFIVILLTNKYLWRFKWFRFITGISIPVIQGRWEGFIRSSFSKHKKKHYIKIEITQTLRNVNVWYYDSNAYSYSLIANFVRENESGPYQLFVIYRNIPTRTKDKNLQPHNGVMELNINDNADKIHGIYYNNSHQRETYGEIFITYSSKKLLKQFEND